MNSEPEMTAEFGPDNKRADWIQRRVSDRAAALGMTAYALAKASGVSETHVRDYLQWRKSMTTDRLQHVLRALGLDVTPK